jgi:long-chain acyl-CoA synthetase
MDIQLPAQSIYGAFAANAQAKPRAPALYYLGQCFSFQELHRLVTALAAGLAGLGVSAGDRVILYTYNIPQTVIAWLALQRLGAVGVPVAPVYGAHDLRYLANDSGAEIIVCMDSNFNYVAEVWDQTPFQRAVVTNMLDLVPAWKRLIARSLERVPRGRMPDHPGVQPFTRLLRQARGQSPPPFSPPGPDTVAMILYTGGTTGFPKGVPLPVGLYLHNLGEWRRASLGVVPPGQAVTALAAPLYHVIGQMDAMTPLLVLGEPVILLPRVVLDGMFHQIQRYRATNLFAVPALYRMILEHDRLDHYDLSSLRYCGVGGDALPVEVARRWKERFGIPLYQGYGATEFCGAITLSYAHHGEPPLGSIGRLTRGSRVRLVDPETLEPVPPGQPGELLGLMPHGVTGYWNKPQETAQSFLEIDRQRWYRTRDIVRQDQDGWFYFLDRSVDMIKHKGYRVAAAEIERVLQEHPAVIAACAVGVPDPKVGERIKAFVVPKSDVRGVSSFELIKWCRERLAPYKVPHYIEFRDMLPKSKVGKMLRREMRDEERRKLEA